MAPIMNETAKVNLITCFADALRKAIGASRKEEWFCAASSMAGDVPALVVDPGALVMRARLRGTIRGEVSVEIASKDAGVLFPEADVESTAVEESWQALMERTIQQLPKRAADAGVFAFSVESHGHWAPCGESAQIGRIELIEADRTLVPLRVLADRELLESLKVADWNAFRSHSSGKEKELPVPELGRVIDVPLNVTLRFGHKNMRLCEVLELNSGAVLELDRQVEDPVDLILDERVIARGEVVIVDGNYGLRVTEIVERHPTLVV
jgi:flagellar motor switch protein FliN